MGAAVTCTVKWTGPCLFWGEWHHCARVLIHEGDHVCECGEDVVRIEPRPWHDAFTAGTTLADLADAADLDSTPTVSRLALMAERLGSLVGYRIVPLPAPVPTSDTTLRRPETEANKES